MTRTGVPVLTAALAALLLAPGCGEDEECTCPVCPTAVPDPTLDNIWPNADGTAWTYALTERTWPFAFPGSLYEDEEDVPPAPTMDELVDLMSDHAIGDPVDTEEGTYRLRFDGEITTDSGVTAQNLVATVYSDTSAKSAGLADQPTAILLARILLARPDLREKLASKVNVFAGQDGPILQWFRELVRREDPRDVDRALKAISLKPLFLHGYAWEKTDEWIGGYGDIDKLLAWKYLEADLGVGHEFTHQLLPSFADDVFLHARILTHGTYRTEAGTFQKAVECLYLLDYGVWAAVGEGDPDPIGYQRLFDYATIVYAPTVGPIYSYERRWVQPGKPPTTGMGDLVISLIRSSRG